MGLQGVGDAVDLGAVQGDPIGGDFQSAGAGEALISQHELGVTGRAEQVGGSLEDQVTAGVGDVNLLVTNDAKLCSHAPVAAMSVVDARNYLTSF